jgi:uncharacterized protein
MNIRRALCLILLPAFAAMAAKGPFNDQPVGPQSLPGDNLPPFNMLDSKGQLTPMPKLDRPLHAGPSGAPESTAPGPSLELATEMARAAVDACTHDGYLIGATVIDSVGEARAMLTADGSDGSHVFVAMRKALTALAFGVPSAEANQLVTSGKAPMSKVTPAMFVMGGAVPIFRDGELIGAVGASGAAGGGPYMGYNDEKCARAGLAKVAARLARSAPPVAACPMMNEPYSARTSLFDLLINPEARAALAKTAPGLAGAMPGLTGGAAPTAPSITAIMTPEWMLRMRPNGAEAIAALDAALKDVPLTSAAKRARCARYDTKAPELPQQIAHPAILVFEKINGFRDGPSVNAAGAALRAMAERRGWTLVFSDNGAVMNPRDLARFDAVVWNNISGDALTVPQRAAFQRYIERGGGFAAMHGSGGDFYYPWAWYADTLLGARFIGHPAQPQFQDARVVIDDRADPIVAGLGAGWTMNDEWYSFAVSPRKNGAHVLATLDESSYKQVGMTGQSLSMGDHPIAWTRCVGKGRSFYSAIGHRPEAYADPHAAQLLEQGIAWALGQGERRCVKPDAAPAAASR